MLGLLQISPVSVDSWLSLLPSLLLRLQFPGCSHSPPMAMSPVEEALMWCLTRLQACELIEAAIAEARRQQLAPIGVAVLDCGGNLIAFQREDGAGIARYQIAFAKAWGALGMGYGSRELAGMAEQMPAFVASLTAVLDGRLVPAPGGVLLFSAAGNVIGAVGVSGDTSNNDELCALAGVAALQATPGDKNQHQWHKGN